MTLQKIGLLLIAFAGLHGPISQSARCDEYSTRFHLTSDNGSSPTKFCCVISSFGPDSSEFCVLERKGQRFSILLANGDGTPRVIANNSGLAWFDIKSLRWRFVQGMRVESSFISTAEEALRGSMTISIDKDHEGSEFDIDLSPMMGSLEKSGFELMTAIDKGYFSVPSKTHANGWSIRLEFDKALATYPLKKYSGHKEDQFFSVRFEVDQDDCVGWSAVSLPELAKRLGVDFEKPEDDTQYQSFEFNGKKPSGVGRGKAWEILAAGGVAAIPREPASERFIRAYFGANIGDKSTADSFSMDRVSHYYEKTFRFRIERDGQESAFIMLTNAGQPVALARHDWLVTLHSVKGWILSSPVETTCTHEFKPFLGENALGIHWTAKDLNGSLNIQYDFRQTLAGMLRADWRRGKSPGTMTAIHPDYPRVNLAYDITLAEDVAECSLRSIKMRSGSNHWDETTVLLGSQANLPWTKLSKAKVIAELNPSVEPLDPKQLENLQLLQHGLTSSQRKYSERLLQMVMP